MLAVPVAAIAHGELSEGRPGPGQTVGGKVGEIELRFEEELDEQGLAISVTDPEGLALAVAEPKVVAEVIVRIEIPTLTKPGEYRVDYAVPSLDGFLFEGAYLFSFEPSAPPIEPFPEGRASAGTTLLIAAAGTLLFAGGGWLLVRRQSRLVRNRR